MKTSFSQVDKSFMLRALELARAAKGKTFPNPAVGAVVVSNGRIAGEGATKVCGGPHAEKVALAAAGSHAHGSTLYVTLEPCCHHGKTPPCTGAIIEAGVRRVVVAVKDPNPLVAGKGTALLRRHGIEVRTGLFRDEASLINEDFFWYIVHKRPWVTLKLALTLDGRIADPAGNSRWITSEASRAFVHELRRCHAAVAVGRATLEKDDPRLTVRHVKGCSPARIVLSPDHSVPSGSYFFTHAHETRSIIVVPGGSRHIEHKDGEPEVWHTGETDRCKSLRAFLSMAFDETIPSIFLEGGQRVASQFLEYGLVNRLYLFYGNKLIGRGRDGILFDKGLPIEKALNLRNGTTLSLGPDFMITGLLI
jgi:diaminohydroxyphosphoribosylaminopyrimidine deaminase / 5-amino-6-(5-phosphoribosylamino)uracil reductase